MSFFSAVKAWLVEPMTNMPWKRDLEEEPRPPPAGPDEKETRYGGYIIRFKKEPNEWVSRVFAPGQTVPLEYTETASHLEGPDVLVARTRRRIDAYVKQPAAPLRHAGVA